MFLQLVFSVLNDTFTANVTKEVNRKCPLHWPWMPQYTTLQTDRQTTSSC